MFGGGGWGGGGGGGQQNCISTTLPLNLAQGCHLSYFTARKLKTVIIKNKIRTRKISGCKAKNCPKTIPFGRLLTAKKKSSVLFCPLFLSYSVLFFVLFCPFFLSYSVLFFVLFCPLFLSVFCPFFVLFCPLFCPILSSFLSYSVLFFVLFCPFFCPILSFFIPSN